MRVFVLGAGFSKSCGYPSGKELFGIIFDYLEQSKWQHFSDLKGICLEALSDLGVNILRKEEVYFDELLLKIKQFSRVGTDHKGIYLSLKMVLTETARSYFYKILKENSEQIKPALSFIRKLNKNVKFIHSDIIVSLNWDLLVEYSISRLGYTFSYDLYNGDIPILKPHGSINWRRMLNYEGIRVIDGFEDYDPEHKVRDAQLMIMPGDEERQQIRKLKTIQDQVEKVLTQTDTIIFIGYSMPYYDVYVKDMINKNIVPRIRKDLMPSKIYVVNPDLEIIGKYKDLFGKDIIIIPQKFEHSEYADD
jgi:hypothetical protein